MIILDGMFPSMHCFLALPCFDDWNAFKSCIRGITEIVKHYKKQVPHVSVVFVKRFNDDVATLSYRLYYPEGEKIHRGN